MCVHKDMERVGSFETTPQATTSLWLSKFPVCQP